MIQKSSRFCAPMLAIVFGLAGLSNGASITLQTPTGSLDAAGDPISARADITTGAGTVSITLQNLLVNPKDVGQDISDFGLSLSNNAGSMTLISGLGVERVVSGGGTYADGATAAAGWVLGTSPGSDIYLNVLAGPGHAGPAHTILALPDATNVYSNANGSIAGNGPHNPFLAGPVTFELAASGVTAGTTVTGAFFSFGTTSGDNVTVPEPGSGAVLLACAAGGSLLGRRRKH